MNEELETKTSALEPQAESMKDYEDQFDIADPWHFVHNYMVNRSTLTV